VRSTYTWQFGRPKLKYLGHIVTDTYNKTKPEHVRAGLEAQVSGSRKVLRAFSVVCVWLREYVPDFTAMAVHLTALLVQRRAWMWIETKQNAFKAIKFLFWSPLVFCRTNRAKCFSLYMYVVTIEMGAMLYQQGDDGVRRIVSYASAKLTPAESKYHSNE
jgi:hypothetical protein